MKRAYLFALFLPFLLAACATLPPVTAQDVVQMSQAGVPPGNIIQRMKEAGTVYYLSSNDIVRLHEQGVPPAVLDYMQGTYVEEARQEELDRAYMSGYWPFGWW